jgi:transposase
MDHHHDHQQHQDCPANAPPTPVPRPPRAPKNVDPQTREQILELAQFYGSREIARRIGRSRGFVRRVLRSQTQVPHSPSPSGGSKLDPFREQIAERVAKGLSVTRILREIRELEYEGGRTILADLVRSLRVQQPTAPRKKIKRRFETRPGLEMQIDWSPYRIRIDGRAVTVHALGCLMAYSRKLSVQFFSNERQPTLLEGLASAFEYYGGCALRLVMDNMSTAVLARIGSGGRPLWHPRFLEFTAHYGVEPVACAVRDPNRKGKKEKSFRLLWEDFLKGSEFLSWEDLDRRVQIWLDHTPDVGNLRLHGTTRQIPNQAFLAEKDLLIPLPEQRFPVYEDSVRVVDQDSTLSIYGTRYTVPAHLAMRSVPVRLYAQHFEVLDSAGRIAFARRYVAQRDKGKLIIDPTHYANLPRRPRDGSDSNERLDRAFLRRFPEFAPFVEGLTRRMKSLTPIHIRALLRLVEQYGETAFVEAARHAQGYRRFDAAAVQRILERRFPMAGLEPLQPLHGRGPALLGEVESPSLDAYADLDRTDAGDETNDDTSEDDDGTHHAAQTRA